MVTMLINFSVSVVDSEPTCENTSSDSQIYYSESGCSFVRMQELLFKKYIDRTLHVFFYTYRFFRLKLVNFTLKVHLQNDQHSSEQNNHSF